MSEGMFAIGADKWRWIARVMATVEGPHVVAISVGAKAVDDEITLSE